MNRDFKCKAETLFKAIGEGVLFKMTGVIEGKWSADFKEGGAIHLEWNDCSPVKGVFTKITPHTNIDFTWDYFSKGADKYIETDINIIITENENGSNLQLIHTGFHSEADRADHNDGWTSSVKDFSEMMES